MLRDIAGPVAPATERANTFCTEKRSPSDVVTRPQEFRAPIRFEGRTSTGGAILHIGICINKRKLGISGHGIGYSEQRVLGQNIAGLEADHEVGTRNRQRVAPSGPTYVLLSNEALDELPNALRYVLVGETELPEWVNLVRERFKRLLQLAVSRIKRPEKHRKLRAWAKRLHSSPERFPLRIAEDNVAPCPTLVPFVGELPLRTSPQSFDHAIEPAVAK